MKTNVDIHTYLATNEDMEDWHEDAADAADCFNAILHLTYDRADEDIDSDTLIERLEKVWEYWHTHGDLCLIETEDLINWVDNELNT